jgi:dihydrodipicolinate synthase/N-acetylneuraminate lyase
MGDRHKLVCRGVVVPMVTPVTAAGAIDEPAVGRIIDHLIAGGADGIFVLGTTGEALSVHPDDKRVLVAAAVRFTAGRAAVYAGVSANCVRESNDGAVAFQQLGADAVVAHMPCYYPLTNGEIESYFLHLADRSPLPLVPYNIPATTHQSIAVASVERLRLHPNIVAIKDSSGDEAHIADLLAMTGGRNGFPVLLGNSALFVHGLRLGAVGLVPSGAHLVPALYRDLLRAAMSDRWPDAERFHVEAELASQAYRRGRTLGQSLAVLKAIMEQRGLCRRTMLAPLADHVGELPAAPAADSTGADA